MARAVEVFGVDEARRGVAVGLLGVAVGNTQSLLSPVFLMRPVLFFSSETKSIFIPIRYIQVGNAVAFLLSMAFGKCAPAILLRFLREHRSEWADNSIDAYLAAAVKVGPCILPRARAGSFGGQVILPLAHTIEHEELLEVIKLEGVGHYPEDAIMPRGHVSLARSFEKAT
ncbi:hypothetical protein HYC85_006360 [Camellia sinensis]|uniref:Uncharacterized protein n=1 Tax=Camellia sinensis TaxID=4442 RepID=A0A7J7HNF1_CAMSI|nr:hypothetical protein HYC85_006360 [Camellia sinensis]